MIRTRRICARGYRKNSIAIRQRMRRIDRPRKSILRHLRDLGHLRLVESNISGYHSDGRVRPRRHLNTVASSDLRHRIHKSRAIRCSRPRNDLPGFWIYNISHGIHRYNRAHHHPRLRNPDARGSQTRFHRLLPPEHLPHRCSRARAHIAFRHIPGRRVLACLVARFRCQIGRASCRERV